MMYQLQKSVINKKKTIWSCIVLDDKIYSRNQSNNMTATI